MPPSGHHKDVAGQANIHMQMNTKKKGCCHHIHSQKKRKIHTAYIRPDGKTNRRNDKTANRFGSFFFFLKPSCVQNDTAHSLAHTRTRLQRVDGCCLHCASCVWAPCPLTSFHWITQQADGVLGEGSKRWGSSLVPGPSQMRCRSFLCVCVLWQSPPPFFFLFLLSRCQTFTFPVFWVNQFPRILFHPHLHYSFDTRRSFIFHLQTSHQVSKRWEMLPEADLCRWKCCLTAVPCLGAQPLVRSSWEQKITLRCEALAFINIACLTLFSLVTSRQDFHIALAVTLWTSDWF